MRHYATASFWKSYEAMPVQVRALADKNFDLLKSDPDHPSLRFKRVSGELWSARVGLRHRALAIPHLDGFAWIWIGTHAEYDKLVG